MPPRGKVDIADTNVLLRYLMKDDPAQSPAANAFMARVKAGTQRVEIRESVLTETVWTLRSFFSVPRHEIAEKLAKVMSLRGVRSPAKPILIQALGRYGTGKADFVDCVLAAAADEHQTDVITFDETDFPRLTPRWRIPA